MTALPALAGMSYRAGAFAVCLAAAAPGAGAETPAPPRLGQAREQAALERRVAEQAVASSSAAARPAAERALGRARAWEEALAQAATAAQPVDADLLIAAVRGEANLVRGGATLAARGGQLLREGDELVCGDGGLEARFHDGSSVVLEADTSVRVLLAPRSRPQQSSFLLARGALAWESRAAPPGTTKLLTTKSMVLLKPGRVRVGADPAGTARVEVFEGGAEVFARPEAAPGRSPGWERLYEEKLDRR